MLLTIGSTNYLLTIGGALAVNVLRANLASEVAARIAGDQASQGAIATETARATAAEATMRALIGSLQILAVSGDLTPQQIGNIALEFGAQSAAQVSSAIDQGGSYRAAALGLVGDGATDDSAHFTAALTTASGRRLMLPDRYLLDSSVNVPSGTTISGVAGNPARPNLYEGVYDRPSLIKVGQTGAPGLVLNRGSVLENITVAYAGLAAQPTTEAMIAPFLASYAGVGVETVDADPMIRNAMFAGLDTAIICNPNDSIDDATASFQAHNIRIDCRNGIVINKEYDIIWISDVEGIPFLPADVPGMTKGDYKRSGTFLTINVACDGGHVFRHSCYGWNKGVVITDGVNDMTWTDCGYDNSSGNPADGDSPVAFTMTGDVWGHRFLNYEVEAADVGFDMTSTAATSTPAAQWQGGRIACNTGLLLNDGDYYVQGTVFYCSVVAIDIGPNCGNVTLIAPMFIGGPVSVRADPAWTGFLTWVVSPNVTGNEGVPYDIPPALFENGQISISDVDAGSPAQNISNRPECQYARTGTQAARSMYSAGAPATQKRWRETIDEAGGAYRIQASTDDDTGVYADALAFTRSGQYITQVYINGLYRYANDAAAEAGVPGVTPPQPPVPVDYPYIEASTGYLKFRLN